jgi:hypothetical protein
VVPDGFRHDSAFVRLQGIQWWHGDAH